MKLPPGPSTNFVEQHWRWYNSPFEFLDECAEKYGDTFTIRLSVGRGHYPMVFIHNPATIEALFTADVTQFVSGDANKPLSLFLGQNSLLTIDDAQHRRHRRLMTPPFHGERMRALSTTMLEVAKNKLQTIKIGEPFCVTAYMLDISLKIILRTVFGMNEDALGKELGTLMTDALNTGSSVMGYCHGLFPVLRQDLGPISWWGRSIRRGNRIDQIIGQQIAACKSQTTNGRHDILSMFVSARDGDSKALTDQEIRDELITLLVSGHETTGAAISWALYWLHRTPAVKDKLLAELSTLKDLSDPAAITHLPYLTAVCQETLRINPVIMIAFVRMTKGKFRLQDYEFAASTNLTPCIYLTHHRKSIYDDPKTFRPERFLEKDFSQYEFFPFGGSNRKCIGASFAMQEMKLILALMLTSWTFKPESRRVMHPRRRGIAITLPEEYRLIKVAGL